MAAIPVFDPSILEALAKALGECGTGSEITRILAQCSLVESSGESTKWKRLEAVFRVSQERDGCANKVIQFLQLLMAPARFIGKHQEYSAHREELNRALSFAGLRLGDDGQLVRIEAARTLTQAEQRAHTLSSKFQGRAIHPQVLHYCRAELLQDNYFHALFEACKGLAQRIRELSGLQFDGAALVDKAFCGTPPLLAINRLVTESERSEQTGFAHLLRGCFGSFRNPLAHGPKILWEGEEDAADVLSLLSLLHRKLDGCVRIPTSFREL